MTADAVLTDSAAVALRTLLARRAVEQRLCAADSSSDDVDAAIEALITREVDVPSPTTDDCRRWYEGHADAYVVGELAFVRHILFAVTPGTPVEALRRKAEAILAELRRTPERFDASARELSNCPSGAHGGTLGQLARGDSVPELEAAIFGTEASGVLPTLVNTRFGFHVVAVDRRVAGRRVPFELVAARIAEQLSKQSWTRALAQYAQVVASQARAAESGAIVDPLVQ